MRFPATTIGKALPPETRAAERNPASVSAHVTPETSASRLPACGFGAVACGAALPQKNRIIPIRRAAPSRGRPAAASPSGILARSRAGIPVRRLEEHRVG